MTPDQPTPPERADATVDASVIVPSYRGVSRLPALLDSLAAQSPGGPSFEVVVVLDGVDDGSAALLRRERRITVRTVLLPAHGGRVVALNTGFETARGEVLIRCDDDLVVPRGFVAAHVRAHREARTPIGVIGLTQDVHRDSPYARAYGREAAARSLAEARNRRPGQRWRLWAADCSITRATWRRVGPYDTSYRAYGWEDVDYGYRLHAAGVPLQIVREAGAQHHGPARSAEARTRRAHASGAARTLFHRLHPEAALPAPSPGRGTWGTAVALVARAMPTEDAAARWARLVDRALPRVPPVIGRKLVALAVEGAGIAGGRCAPRSEPGTRPRVAIAHDYLTQRGGAERVVLALCRAFPEAEVHTLFYAPDQTYPEFADRTIRVSGLNRIGLLRRDPRRALPLLPFAARRMRIDADVVIASTSGWAHAFPTTGRKIAYCHSPARWLYLSQDYLGQAGRLSPQRLAIALLGAPLRRWDQRAARTVERYLANSSVVRERIRRVYGISAATLFPPSTQVVTAGEPEPIGGVSDWGIQGGHYLVVSRLQPYKHIDRVIEAFRAMPERRLLVVGKGPLREQLQQLAPANVRLVEGIPDEQMHWAYGTARALITAAQEDFGLAPLEAGGHGIPTVALRAGGFLDSIRDGVNGLFFDEPTAEAIIEAVHRLDVTDLPADAIREHVASFGEEHFVQRIREIARLVAERGRDARGA